LLDLTAPPMAGSRRPGHVEHEKKTFFSLLENTRSGGISQGREAPPQRAERSAEPLRMLERRVRRVSGEEARLTTTFHEKPRLKTIRRDEAY
jgi:hypothetical protein